MKIFSAEQIRAIDAYTIQHEPIRSLDLMERAAKACFDHLKKHIHDTDKILVICGMGNNGGDGLALARLLNEAGLFCDTVLVRYAEHLSADAEANYQALKNKFPERLKEVEDIRDLQKSIHIKYSILIDALLGTGLNKPVEGVLAEAIKLINAQNNIEVISIDVPSGLFVDRTSKDQAFIVKADLVLSFQFPKLAFLMAENSSYVKNFVILDIGLHSGAISQQHNNYFFVTDELIASLLMPRTKFSHKGDHGHALLLAGSKGKSGAAIISSKACMRSGAGLLTLHSTETTLQALLQHLPEAMSSADSNSDYITEVNSPENYDAIAFGPGVGLNEDTQRVLKKLLQYYPGRLVIDADGLNALAENKTWLSFLPPNSILTPHPKEFERLTNKHENDFARLEVLRQFSIKHQCVVVLKSAHTAIAMPDGNVFFNSSGNAGLAKAGSGDGLTGILLALLSRGYSAPRAALIGVFVHGYAADLCVEKMSMEGLLITDVIEQLPYAFRNLEAKANLFAKSD